MDVSWSSKGGLESRFEVYGEGGRIVQDIISSPLRAFIERPAGYLGEKVDADTGWVYPVPNETYAHGHDAMMADVVERLPRRTAAARDVRGRAHRQRDPRRRLPLDRRAATGKPSRPATGGRSAGR